MQYKCESPWACPRAFRMSGVEMQSELPAGGEWPITTHNGNKVHSVPNRQYVAGRLGGLQTYLRYGSAHMSTIGRKGGRPTRQEAAYKAWNAYDARRKTRRAAWTLKEVRRQRDHHAARHATNTMAALPTVVVDR